MPCRSLHSLLFKPILDFILDLTMARARGTGEGTFVSAKGAALTEGVHSGMYRTVQDSS